MASVHSSLMDLVKKEHLSIYPLVIKHGNGKSHFNRKITDKWSISQHAMFDYQRVSILINFHTFPHDIPIFTWKISSATCASGTFVQDHELRSGTERRAERSAKLPGAGAQWWQSGGILGWSGLPCGKLLIMITNKYIYIYKHWIYIYIYDDY